MRAAYYPGQGRSITIENLPDPEPESGEILIRVHRCGICGTDMSMTKGRAWDYGPGQFGHEYAGEVVGLGRDVDGFRVGDLISVLPSLSCSTCDAVHGNPVLCRHEGGVTRGFAELAVVPARAAIKLPQVLSITDGALIEPMAISLYGVRQSHIVPGDRVLVLGGGTVALYAIYWARRLGAGRIVVMSRSERRRDMARAMGADAFIRYGDSEIGEVAEALGGAPNLVFECVGAEGMLGRALKHVAPFGRIISLGFCTAPDPIVPAVASYKCATMQFVVGYGMRDFLYVANQMDKGHVDPKTIITNTVSLNEMPAMFGHLNGPNDETKVHVLL